MHDPGRRPTFIAEPLDRGDYAVAFSDDQWTRLSTMFPDGVCDYSKSGVEQQGLIGTWLEF